MILLKCLERKAYRYCIIYFYTFSKFYIFLTCNVDQLAPYELDRLDELCVPGAEVPQHGLLRGSAHQQRARRKELLVR